MITAIIFTIVLSILIFVHELGHFLVAKRSGMKVEEFGFGFPPRIWGIKKGGTIYSVNWIPFGGFVKILGEDGEAGNNPQSFSAAKAWVRSMVLVAGVAMNVLLAVVLLSILNATGLRVDLSEPGLAERAQDIKVQIAQVNPSSPAQNAGLNVLDEIIWAGFEGVGTEIKEVSDIQNFINNHKGQEINLKIRRGLDVSAVNLTPRINPPAGEGALGIYLAKTGLVKYPWYQAIGKGLENTYYGIEGVLVGYGSMLKKVFSGYGVGVELTGPIGIAVITGQAAKLGLSYLAQLTALLSINLAVLNIVPFPALDGGRLLFVIIEKIKGSPVPRRIESIINATGFALLIMLMFYVTTKDIIKLF